MYRARGKHARPVRRLISAAGASTAVALAVVVGLTMAGPAAAATVTVTEASLGNGWDAVVQAGGTTAFVNADSPLNGGALQLATTDDNASKAALYTTLHQGTLVSAVTDLGYQTKTVVQGDPAGDVSYQLGIDLDGSSATTNDRTTLVYEPYWQDGGEGDPDPVVPGVWQTWDVYAGLFWSTQSVGGFTAGSGGPPLYTLTQIKTVAGPSATVTVVGVNVGTYNPGYTLLTDGLTFNGTTYDFQPRGITKEDCKNGGWSTMAETFVNQGDCVSFYASGGKTHK